MYQSRIDDLRMMIGIYVQNGFMQAMAYLSTLDEFDLELDNVTMYDVLLALDCEQKNWDKVKKEYEIQ